MSRGSPQNDDRLSIILDSDVPCEEALVIFGLLPKLLVDYVCGPAREFEGAPCVQQIIYLLEKSSLKKKHEQGCES